MARTFEISIPEIAPTATTEIVEVVSEQLVIDATDASNRTWSVVRNGKTIANYLSPGQYGTTYEAYLIHNANKVYPNGISLLAGVETVTTPGGAPTDLTYRFNYQTGVLTFDEAQDPTRVMYFHAYRLAFLGGVGGGETVINQTVNHYTTIVNEDDGDSVNHKIISSTHSDSDQSSIPYDGNILTYRGSSGFKVGTFTGNGGTQSITNVGFRPSFIMLKDIGGDASHAHTIVKTDTMPLAINVVNGGDDDHIPTFDVDGFTVVYQTSASTGRINESGATCHYAAAGGESVRTGSYDGTGTAFHLNAGFAPKLVYIIPESGGALYMRTPEMSAESYEITFDSGDTDRITGLTSTGVEIGDGACNDPGETYHYVIWTGDVASGTYIADYEFTSPHTQPPTALPFDIAQVVTRTGEGASQIATYRQSTNLSGSMSFSGIATEQPSRILSMEDRQILFGDNAEVDNNPGIIHYWWAFGESTATTGQGWRAEPPELISFKPISHWDYIIDVKYSGADGSTVRTENGRDVLMFRDFVPAIVHSNTYRTGVNDSVSFKIHPGLYSISTSITINAFSGERYFEGPGGTYTTYTGLPIMHQAILSVENSSSGIKCEGNEYISWRGVSFEGDGSATVLAFNFPSWGFVDNCYFGTGGAVSIYVDTTSGTNGLTIKDSVFGQSAAPIYLQGATKAFISGCNFWNSGISVKIQNSDMVAITNNMFSGYITFTSQTSNNVKITDNIFNTNLPNYAIRFQAGGAGVTGMDIADNTFYVPSGNAIDFGSVTNYCLAVTINSNTFWTAGGPSEVGILGNTSFVRNSIASDNTFYGFTADTYCIRNWTGPGNEAMHNICSDGTTKVALPDIGSPVGHGGSAVPANHNHTAADGGTLTASEVDSYMQYTEIAHPTSTPAADNLWLYGADDGGLTKLYYKLQDGTTVGPLGAGGASHSAVTLNAAIDANLLDLSNQELQLATQAQFNVFAGPSGAATGTPAFRNLVAGDLPQKPHDHTTGDGSGVLTKPEFDDYSQYTETTHPTNTPAANNLWLYGADDGGLTKLFYKLQDGTTIGPLGSGGGGGSLDASYTIGRAIEVDLGVIDMHAGGGGTAMIQVRRTADSDPRMRIEADGLVIWGDGAGTGDRVWLYRSGPFTMSFEADGSTSLVLNLDGHFVLSDLGGDPVGPSPGQTRIYTKSGEVYRQNSSNAKQLLNADHAADAAAHHSAVSLNTAISNNLLGLSNQELSLDTQAQYNVFAGPSGAATGTPAFRNLVDGDISFHTAATATATNPSHIEIATQTEVDTGTDTGRAVVPDTLAEAIQDGSFVYGIDASGTDTYSITLTPTPTNLANGQMFRFKAGSANTSTANLIVNGQAAKPLYKGFNSPLITGDIMANQILNVVYNSSGDCFQIFSPTARPVPRRIITLTLSTDTVTPTGLGYLNSWEGDPLTIGSIGASSATTVSSDHTYLVKLDGVDVASATILNAASRATPVSCSMSLVTTSKVVVDRTDTTKASNFSGGIVQVHLVEA